MMIQVNKFNEYIKNSFKQLILGIIFNYTIYNLNANMMKMVLVHFGSIRGTLCINLELSRFYFLIVLI